MRLYVYVVGDSLVRLWGLTCRERLRRQLAELTDAEVVGDVESIPDGARALCVRADYLFETRTLKAFAEHPRAMLRCSDDGALAAAVGPAADAESLASALRDQPAEHDFVVIEPSSLSAYEEQLRKAEEPLLLPVSEHMRADLEDRLYGRSYKGITDLVTKWFWPRPAKRAARICMRLGLTPNMVTLSGLVLVICAGFAFYLGEYWLGLIAGWFMTFLDTVDGKLARMTVRSSQFGHLLDHGIDIVHPPIWYILWGLSLPGPLLGIPLVELYWWVFAAYLAGRLIEGAFHGLGACGIFDWRPFDAYFRLVTARRNPCLIILTLGMLAGSPAGAFLGVVGWTVVTSLVLLVRLLQALYVRVTSGPLESWLADPVRAAERFPQVFRSFSRTRGAYGE